MAKKLEEFRSHLEEFALKHRNDIRKDPQFRAQFHKMCAAVGVDPLASNKGAGQGRALPCPVGSRQLQKRDAGLCRPSATSCWAQACGRSSWDSGTFTTSWACRSVRCAAAITHPCVNRMRLCAEGGRIWSRGASVRGFCLGTALMASTRATLSAAEATMAARSLNGGLMELGQLRAAVLKRRGRTADPVSDEDILRAIDSLKCVEETGLCPCPALRMASCPATMRP